MHKPILGYGLCQCGCGQKTTIAAQTTHARGDVKGEPKRFALAHCPGNGPVEFWRRVDSVSQDPLACWVWPGRRQEHGHGYGTFGKRIAHRLIYESVVGAIPDGLFVLHSCDNPPCVNPAHLRLGTHEDNMNDMTSRKRASNPGRRLKEAELSAMVERYRSGGITQPQLAAEVGLTAHAVGRILRRRMAAA